uniref:Storkhead-box protein 1 n=1 Tax=Monodelphis domestica TaxID=13616 RepID=H9H6F0_MONDO
MNPITQSQFIPLAEVLCCAIADMNAAHVVVTQESLLDQLVKHYPGIATPSQEVLYSTLGSLIKERKIYHTGEGYFIVTPQTYFITSPSSREKRAALEEGHDLPPSVTYLVSMDSQAEGAREKGTSPSHCKSCRCFPDPCPGEGRGPPAAEEAGRKGQKNPGEAGPSGHSQAISTADDLRVVCEGPRPRPPPKTRRRAGSSGSPLFWRQMSRKERPKKDRRTFSAQFPPEEWPVRDEENLDNIPRDIEHEIIKRINPELTVDNLVRHTVLMQKYEERKKYMSQGTSTDLVPAGHKQQPPPGKAGGRRRQSRSGRHRRKAHSNRERSRGRSQRGSQAGEPRSGIARPEELSGHLPEEAVPRARTPEQDPAQTPLGDPRGADPHFIYKKRISNPFPGFPHRGNPALRGYKGQKDGDPRPRQLKKPPGPFQRSRSLDSSRNVDGEAQQPCPEQPQDKAEPLIPSHSSVQPIADDFQDGLSNDSPSGVLRTGGQGHPCRESPPACLGQDKAAPDVPWKIHSRVDRLGETQLESRHHSRSRAPGCGLADPAVVLQFQNLSLLDRHPRQPKRLPRDTPRELPGTAFVKCWENENEGFTDEDDEQPMYQKEADGDEDACSSLEEDEDEDEDFAEKHILCPARPGHLPYSFTCGSLWDDAGKASMTEGPLGHWNVRSGPTEHGRKTPRLEPQTPESRGYGRPAGSLAEADRRQKVDLSGETRSLRPFGCRRDEEAAAAKRVQVSSELVDGSIFDYYNTSEADSEAETLQNSPGEVGEKPACWALGPPAEETRKHGRQKPELFSDPRMPVLAQRAPQEQNHLEGTENHSLTGDSGIDSPRTQSLTSNNSVLLEGLKRRRSFLQNFEGLNSTRNRPMLTSNSLLQLTPVINV